jgi:membrane-bound lytic murein transglycosylase B
MRHVAAAKKREKQGKHASSRARRRHRKMVAAAGAMLLIPAVVSSEPAISSTASETALDGVGNGLMGLTDPETVNTDGTLSQSDQIGADLLRDAGNPAQLGLDGLDLPSGPLGIPGVMLDAYKRTEATLAKSQPNCHLSWSLLASIARIESSHARGGQVFANGDTINPILGPVLNGGGFAAIADTDGGRYDGDNRWDRAVGAFQFIPSTWTTYASDGNGDRIANPNNVFDASLAAGKYLCSGGLDLADPQQRAASVFRYNHSDTYVRVVLIWADAYLQNVTPIPTTPLPTIPMVQAVAPPVEPGPADSTTTTTTTPLPDTTTTTPPTTTTPTTPTTPTCPPATPPPSSSTPPSTPSTPPSSTPTTPTCPPSTDPTTPPSSTPTPTTTTTTPTTPAPGSSSSTNAVSSTSSTTTTTPTSTTTTTTITSPATP